MTPSKYQRAIYSFVQGLDAHSDPDHWVDFQGKRNAVVEAVAGSGKTTTIVKSLDFLNARKPVTAAQLAGGPSAWDSMFAEQRSSPSNPKVLFVAFNKHISEELQRRVPSYVTASTLNSVGWGVCRASCKTELDANKDENILRTIMDLSNPVDKAAFYKIKNVVSKMVGLLKALVIKEYDQVFAQFDAIADKYDVTIPELQDVDVKHLTVLVWEKSVSHTRHMSFDDQIFQPIYQGWTLPSYDWVFGDECQDWSPLNLQLVKGLGRNGRIVAVGDRHQAIYGFRGADPDSIKNCIEELDAVTLPLSICYRCPSAVIKEAQKIVPHVEEPEDNPNGAGSVEWVTTPEFISGVLDGEYVLCRTTAPLVKRCLELIGRKRKATVKGRDIGRGLVNFLDDLEPSQYTPILEFLDRLAAYKSDRVEKLSKMGRDTEAQAVEDKCDTLSILAMDCTTTGDIRKRVDQVFSDSDSPGVTLMTVHRCKGLEAKVIWILRPDLMPHPKSKKPWQKTQENNLLYVAQTRSQSELYFVEKEKGEK